MEGGGVGSDGDPLDGAVNMSFGYGFIYVPTPLPLPRPPLYFPLAVNGLLDMRFRLLSYSLICFCLALHFMG